MWQSLRRTGMDVGPVLLRVLLAVVGIYHGYPKVFQGGAAGLSAGLGIPLPLAWLAAVTEFFGGTMILLGLLTRFWSMGFAILMLVAIVMVHGPNGFDSLQQRKAWYGRKTVTIESVGVTVELASPLQAEAGEGGKTVVIRGGPKAGYEYNVALLLVSLSLVLMGPGRYSVDHGACRRLCPSAARAGPEGG